MKTVTVVDHVRRLVLLFFGAAVLAYSGPSLAGVVLSKQGALTLRSMVAKRPLARGATILVDDMMFDATPVSIQGFTPGNRWPSAVIPIAFDGGLDTTKRAQFMNACALWTTAGISCIARTSQANYVIVSQRTGDQCGGSDYVSCSRVGMVGGAQGLYVAVNHWGLPGVIAHEIGHALGLLHEHMRSDRNTWVQVFLQNADPNSPPQFAAVGGRTLSAYDMKSIMHYQPCAFSIYPDCSGNYAHRVIEAKHCRIKETPQPSQVPTAYDNFSIRTLYQLPGAVDPGPWMPPFEPVQVACGPSCRTVGSVKYGRVNYNEFTYHTPPVPPNPPTLQSICRGFGQAALPRGRKTIAKAGQRLVVTVSGNCGCPNTV